MKKIYCRQYFYDARKRDDIDKFVTECIAQFIKVQGYKPTLLTAQQEMLEQMHVRKDIDVQFEKVQRNHIRLYEVVMYRKPRILPVPVRYPVKMSWPK